MISRYYGIVSLQFNATAWDCQKRKTSPQPTELLSRTSHSDYMWCFVDGLNVCPHTNSSWQRLSPCQRRKLGHGLVPLFFTYKNPGFDSHFHLLNQGILPPWNVLLPKLPKHDSTIFQLVPASSLTEGLS